MNVEGLLIPSLTVLDKLWLVMLEERSIWLQFRTGGRTNKEADGELEACAKLSGEKHQLIHAAGDEEGKSEQSH